MIVLQPPLLCEGWGGHPLCLSGDSPVLMDLHWPCNCTAQCSILSISNSSLRRFPAWSWTVVAFPCFTVVKSFASWYALLLLFFLRFSSISLHCSHIQFSFTFFTHLLILFTSLYFSDPLGSNHFFLFSPSVAQIKNFCSDPEFCSCCFFLMKFARDLTGCLSHCCVEGGDHWIYVCIFVAHNGERCKLPA